MRCPLRKKCLPLSRLALGRLSGTGRQLCVVDVYVCVCLLIALPHSSCFVLLVFFNDFFVVVVIVSVRQTARTCAGRVDTVNGSHPRPAAHIGRWDATDRSIAKRSPSGTERKRWTAALFIGDAYLGDAYLGMAGAVGDEIDERHWRDAYVVVWFVKRTVYR